MPNSMSKPGSMAGSAGLKGCGLCSCRGYAAGRRAWAALLACTLALVVTSAPVLAQKFDRGEALYENHCRTCHESWAHERKGRSVVTSVQDLRQRVAAWASHAGLDWSQEEVGDVSDYLNQTYYHFDVTE